MYSNGETCRVTSIDGRIAHIHYERKDAGSCFIWGFADVHGTESGNIVDGHKLNNQFSEIP